MVQHTFEFDGTTVRPAEWSWREDAELREFGFAPEDEFTSEHVPTGGEPFRSVLLWAKEDFRLYVFRENTTSYQVMVRGFADRVAFTRLVLLPWLEANAYSMTRFEGP